jgi:hypothetical protein
VESHESKFLSSGEEHTDWQKSKAVCSQMFIQEKFEDGKFVKTKARLVADNRIQDRMD